MATTGQRTLRAGDIVVVRKPEEILSTLDADGALDGLPFMPEMVDFCGQRFQVSRRIQKACMEALGYQMQRFPANDVVFLEELRCNGRGHDACDRACMIFWKEAWLWQTGSDDSTIMVDDSQRKLLRDRLKIKTDSDHYFCQSTQLLNATEPFPGKQKPWMFWIAIREIWLGDRTAVEFSRQFVLWTGRMIRRKLFGMPRLRGTQKPTPTESLGLKPGDWVEIKPLAQILETLDRNGDNRGLYISYAMSANCGRRFQVLDNIERIVHETTGKMRQIQNTVSLRGLECHCYYQLGSCPRGDLQYWREIWLKRCEHSRDETV